jgi:hypothetical protein
MGTSLSRFTEYYARHGFAATIRRVRVTLSRALFANRMVVFYCDLATRAFPPFTIPGSFRIERFHTKTELSGQDLETIVSLWNPELALRNINERFAKGASLWLIKSADQLAGYGWTLRGNSIAPYYFPMTPDDVQFFDFYVHPTFRGGAVFRFLVGSILQALKAEGGARAYGDSAEWNQASLASFKMTPFRRLGVVRSFTILGHRFTTWTDGATKRRAPQAKKERRNVPATASSHES